MIVNELKLEQTEAKQFIALKSSDQLIYDFEGQIVSIEKNQLLLKALLEKAEAKKISLVKLEERENAFISLVQHGEVDEIAARLRDTPNLANKITRFGKFSTHSPLYIAVAMKRWLLRVERKKKLKIKNQTWSRQAAPSARCTAQCKMYAR